MVKKYYKWDGVGESFDYSGKEWSHQTFSYQIPSLIKCFWRYLSSATSIWIESQNLLKCRTAYPLCSYYNGILNDMFRSHEQSVITEINHWGYYSIDLTF